MRYWADDSDFYSDNDIGTPDVFVFGGIIVPDGHQGELTRNVEAVKAKYGHARAPVKWNFKDTKKFYSESEETKAMYESMLKSCAWWRAEIFDVLAASRATLLVTAIEAHSADKNTVLDYRDDLARQCFANALMRYALQVKESKEWSDMVIDWPASDDRDPFNDEYASGYRDGKNIDGQPYHSGKMSDLPMADSVLFSTTKHSCMLQIADLVVGSSRDFMKACLLGKDYGPGFAMVRKVRHRFRGAPRNVAAWGLNVSKGNGRFRKKLGDAIFHDIFENPKPRPAPAEEGDIPF